MSSISKLSDKCNKCHYKDICDSKRMMACAIAEVEKHKLINDESVSSAKPLGNPLAVEVTPITIRMGEYGNINTTMENIKESIVKSLSVNACRFGRR